MTYLFYPYFWGRKESWAIESVRTDSDPLFMDFLRAGSARVVIPASKHYDDALRYFFSMPGNVADRIWQGGDPPCIDDDLYRSIAEETKKKTDDLDEATPEGEPWEYTIPTTLVWLQDSSDLPTFEE
jgi:hypothetical protein